MIDFLKYCFQIFNKETDWEENNYYSKICAASQRKFKIFKISLFFFLKI